MDRELVEAIDSLVTYNWRDEETDYSTAALEEGNSREGHIFESLMRVRKWLEDEYGYPHWEPQIVNPEEGK